MEEGNSLGNQMGLETLAKVLVEREREREFDDCENRRVREWRCENRLRVSFSLLGQPLGPTVWGSSFKLKVRNKVGLTVLVSYIHFGSYI